MQFPTLLYNNTDKACCTVETQEQKDALVGYFKDELDHECLPYTAVHVIEAMNMHKDAKAEIVERKEIDLSILKWSELRAEAKKLGVKLPLRAKRDTVEKAIYEVINGNSR